MPLVVHRVLGGNKAPWAPRVRKDRSTWPRSASRRSASPRRLGKNGESWAETSWKMGTYIYIYLYIDNIIICSYMILYIICPCICICNYMYNYVYITYSIVIVIVNCFCYYYYYCYFLTMIYIYIYRYINLYIGKLRWQGMVDSPENVV